MKAPALPLDKVGAYDIKQTAGILPQRKKAGGLLEFVIDKLHRLGYNTGKEGAVAWRLALTFQLIKLAVRGLAGRLTRFWG